MTPHTPLIEALKEWVISPKYPDCFGFWEGDVFRIVGKVDRWDGWKDRVAGIVADHNSRIATETTEPDAAQDTKAIRAEALEEIKQHVGFIKSYALAMTSGNWIDLRDRIVRQSEVLATAIRSLAEKE